jgi:hypothetical protein
MFRYPETDYASLHVMVWANRSSPTSARRANLALKECGRPNPVPSNLVTMAGTNHILRL